LTEGQGWLSSWKGNLYEFRSELSWSWDGVVVERDNVILEVNARILIIVAELLFPLKGGCPNIQKQET